LQTVLVSLLFDEIEALPWLASSDGALYSGKGWSGKIWSKAGKAAARLLLGLGGSGLRGAFWRSAVFRSGNSMGTQSKQGVAAFVRFREPVAHRHQGVVGVLTGSLAILSEAAHSGLDMLAALLTYFAVRAGERPADEAHRFGHAKIESVSAIIETGLLFLASAWIIREAAGCSAAPTRSSPTGTRLASSSFRSSSTSRFSRALALKQAADALERQRLFARKAIGEASTPEEAVAPFAAFAEASG
jgi:hypothetical protein